MAQSATLEGLLQRRAVRQFVKFCIIGFSSMIIDVGISGVLTFKFHWLWYLAKTLSFLIAVTNGYIWNSMWTFRGMGAGKRHEQYMKFLAVNVVGYFLNIGLMKGVFYTFTGQIIQKQKPDFLPWCIATGVAVVFVSLWNFIANKKFTFKD